MNKTNKPKKMSYINHEDANRIERLIDAACNKIETKPLFSQIINEMEGRDNYDLCAAILANKDLCSELKWHFEQDYINDGYTVLKVKEMDKKSKLDEFINTVLFPYYNEQTQFVLFS